MSATAKRRTTASTLGSALGDYARHGHTIHMIGDVGVIYLGADEQDATLPTTLLVELAGQPDRLGIVQIGSTARDRWMVSDGSGGWFDVEFATIERAVEALHNQKTRQRMQERARLRREIADLQRRIDALPAIKGEIVVDERVRCTATDSIGHSFEHELVRLNADGYDEWERCGRPANDLIHNT